MNVVSHNTDAMRSWSSNVSGSADEYDMLVNRLYSLVEQFAGSNQFKGGLSSDFLNQILSQKSAFLKYSSTFRECSELISKRAVNIDNDEMALKNRINRANPLG